MARLNAFLVIPASALILTLVCVAWAGIHVTSHQGFAEPLSLAVIQRGLQGFGPPFFWNQYSVPLYALLSFQMVTLALYAREAVRPRWRLAWTIFQMVLFSWAMALVGLNTAASFFDAGSRQFSLPDGEAMSDFGAPLSGAFLASSMAWSCLNLMLLVLDVLRVRRHSIPGADGESRFGKSG